MRHFLMRSVPMLLSLIVLLTGMPRWSWAFSKFDPPKIFTLSRPCTATRSIHSGGDPVQLTANRTHTAFGLNQATPEGTHVQIDVNGVRKWISLSCGQLSGSTTTSACLPFFDNDVNPVRVGSGDIVDITPPPPVLNAFDEAVNTLCGAPGAPVSPDDFKRVMDEHCEVLKEIRTFTGDRIASTGSQPLSRSAYLDALTHVWFGEKGFEHIFCGERKGNNIGGLHFRGRYLELQQKQLACRLPNNTNREEVKPGSIYTLGVRLKVGDGFVEAPVKGYGLTLSAADIFKVVTKALGENAQACTLMVSDDGETFPTVFVPRPNGVRTFFPDATPDLERNPSCAAPIALPTQ